MPTETAAVPALPVAAPNAASLFRQFVQLLVLIVSMLLLVRTVFLEPFGVPTGSMAPALLGNHREGPCPECGHPIKVGSTSPDRANPQEWAVCPNCGHGPVDLTKISREILGDRLLVDKSAFTLRTPRRWEVAVFYFPERGKLAFSNRVLGAPGEPYVKRVIGLPGEAIQLYDGDVFANGQLCRKTLSQVWQTAIPFTTMADVPEKIGWAPRWVAEAVVADPKLPAAPVPPMGTASVEGSELTLDAAATPETAIGLTYRHRNFKTNKDEPVLDRLGYNGGERGHGIPVHDFALRCEIEVTAGRGMFACRLTDGSDRVKIEIPIADEQEQPTDPAALSHDGGLPPQLVSGIKLSPGKKHRLEFAFVDRRATALLDGVPLAAPLDLPVLPAIRRGFPSAERPAVSRPVQFGVRGATLTIRELVLYRDIHYHAASTQHAFEPYTLAGDEYFMLGDNVNGSEDSRAWQKPGVPEGAFIGKPFFIHQPLRAGRVTVNGNDRQFTTVDWQRVRLLE